MEASLLARLGLDMPGRHTYYTKELADEICLRLSEGETLRAICKGEHMPSEACVRGWANEKREDFQERYLIARELGYHAMVDEIVEISDDGTNDWMEARDSDGNLAYKLNGENVNRSRLRVDTRKWIVGKCLPKLYGDKVLHAGADGEGPIQIEDKSSYDLARRIAFALAGTNDKPS